MMLASRQVKPARTLYGQRWSDSATWPGGIKPTASDAVTIASGSVCILDDPAAVCLSLDINGVLIIDPDIAAVALAAGYINVNRGGAILIGSPGRPYDKSCVFTLNGTESGRVARYVCDVTGGTGIAFDGTNSYASTTPGKLLKLDASTGAVAETVTITFSSSTAFSVSGSVSGSLGSGTVGTLFNNKIRFVATAVVGWSAGQTIVVAVAQRAFKNSQQPRSFTAQIGAIVRIHAKVPTVVQTVVNDHVADGATSIVLADPVDWAAGDEVVVGPTDFYGAAQGVSQRLTVQSVSSDGYTVTFTSGVTGGRWGKLQYVDEAASGTSYLSLTAPNHPNKPHPDVPSVLDERAPVMHLTRHVVIQSVNDSAWSVNGFGVQTMFMGRESDIRCEGVEVRRGGQAGAIGCYAWHFHILSYDMPDGPGGIADATYAGRPTRMWLKGCTVNESAQRAVVIHNTNGVVVRDFNAFDILGHAYFLEDGSERKNEFTRCWVFKVRKPSTANILVSNDNSLQNGASSGWWATNPDNIIEDCRAAECEGFGMWLPWAAGEAHGQGRDIPSLRRATLVTRMGRNVLHSNYLGPINLRNYTYDTRGNVADFRYIPTSNESTNEAYLVEFSINDHAHWKNGQGYNNRTASEKLFRWVSADNGGQDLFGATYAQTIDRQSGLEHALLVGFSLNNANLVPPTRQSGTEQFERSAFASYHETMYLRNSTLVNYPAVAPRATGWKAGGAPVAIWDNYTQGLYKYEQFTGLQQLGCAIWVPPSPHLAGTGDYGTAQVWEDVNGIFPPYVAGQTVIYDHAFFTDGAAGLTSDARLVNAKTTTSRYYHLKVAQVESDSLITDRVGLTKQDINTGATLATWDIPVSSGGFAHMRSMAVQKGGRYRLDLPTLAPAQYLWLDLKNCYRSDDWFIIGLPFNATPGTVALGYMTAYGVSPPATKPTTSTSERRMLSSAGVTGLADIVADAVGSKYWYDAANHLVWLKVVGGLTPHQFGFIEDLSYGPYSLCVWN